MPIFIAISRFTSNINTSHPFCPTVLLYYQSQFLNKVFIILVLKLAVLKLTVLQLTVSFQSILLIIIFIVYIIFIYLLSGSHSVSKAKSNNASSNTKPIPNRDFPNTAELCPNFEKPVSFYLSNLFFFKKESL